MNVKNRKLGISVMDAFCEKCEGKLEFVGEEVINGVTHYYHRCHDCGAKEDLNSIYPRVIFDEFGGEN